MNYYDRSIFSMTGSFGQGGSREGGNLTSLLRFFRIRCHAGNEPFRPYNWQPREGHIVKNRLNVYRNFSGQGRFGKVYRQSQKHYTHLSIILELASRKLHLHLHSIIVLDLISGV